MKDIIKRRKFLEIFGYCSCGLIITSCSTAPITERRQLRLIPESTINKQAAQIYEKIKAKEKINSIDEISQILIFTILYLALIPILASLISKGPGATIILK